MQEMMPCHPTDNWHIFEDFIFKHCFVSKFIRWFEGETLCLIIAQYWKNTSGW